MRRRHGCPFLSPVGEDPCAESDVVEAYAAFSSDDLDGCERALEHAAARLGTPAEEARGRDLVRSVESDIAWVRAWVARKRGNEPAARQWFEREAGLRREVCATSPRFPAAAARLVEALRDCGVSAHLCGDAEAADARFRDAVQTGLHARGAARWSRDVVRGVQETAEFFRGFLLNRDATPADVLRVLEEPIAWLRASHASRPRDDQIADSLARLLHHRSADLGALGRGDEGLTCLDEALAIERDRVLRARPLARYGLAFTLVARGEAAARAGRRDVARADLAEATALFAALRAEDPSHPWADMGECARIRRLLNE
jgi:hypothetical protein